MLVVIYAIVKVFIKGRKERNCNVIGRTLIAILFVIVLSFMIKEDVYAASVSVYAGAGGDISIPATVTDGGNTYSVTSIGNNAFEM